MSDESLRALERQWRKSGEEGDADAYLAERLRVEPQLTLRLIKRMLRIELTVAAMARRQGCRVSDDPTTEQILEWLDTGSIAEAPSVPVATPGIGDWTTMQPTGAWSTAAGATIAPSHPTLYDDMNRGYSEAWLRELCAEARCAHERGMHGPPLDARARGACLSPRCRCSRFVLTAPAPDSPRARPLATPRRRAR